ncbi:hypothetical protein BYT27DRAFT_7124378 [Phlegmacium glaucopus]|nr:hypothetical protein BYT27DRAFT_7124378 [Phlegmacium glaucopus]
MLGVSDVLGYVSITCWLGAQFPQVVENIRYQSCEGLALPFLANWLMGDISNLVGSILTHQLPFQQWLATYFVFVDLMLVVQYAYYYKAPIRSSSALSHIRAASSPARIDRSASRYRTLSLVASNVAAAAAAAAQQDAHKASSARYSQKSDQQRLYERSSSGASGRLADGDPGYDDEGNSPAMADSYHSDGGREINGKRVSWSPERHRTRAASVGRAPTALHILPINPLADLDVQTREDPSNEPLSPVVSRRSSRASRRGSTMVFLGAWALFGIGTLASRRPSMLMSTTSDDIGRVLVSGHNLELSIPVYHSHSDDTFLPNPSINELDTFDPDFAYPRDGTNDESPPKQPSRQQVIGRIFAWLCTTLYLTSRLPQIWKNYVRKSVEGLSMYLFVFAFLGNVFYVASILTSPRNFLPPPQSTQYLRESIPFLLGSGGTLMFDITIVGQSFCYRPRPRRHLSTYGRASDEEEAGLLSADALSPHPPGDSAIMNRGRLPLQKGIPAAMTSPISNPTPYQLRSLVLDYLCHSCYTRTATAFSRDSTIRHLDADGDEIVEATDAEDSSDSSCGSTEQFENIMKQVALRQEIRSRILSGRVDDAIALLQTHFPSVLHENDIGNANTDSRTAEPRPSSSNNSEYVSSTSTEPAHLLLNLRILAFSEACRTVPLEYPPSAHSADTNSKSTPPQALAEPEENPDYLTQQMDLLTKAQKLYAFSTTLQNPLDRATYLKELENVGGLLAYKVPEKSSMAKYLTLERREAVADQINRAILNTIGRPLVSSLELLTRHTHLLWHYANQHGAKSRPGAVLPQKSSKAATLADSENEVRFLLLIMVHH